MYHESSKFCRGLCDWSRELRQEIPLDIAEIAVNHTLPEKLHYIKSRKWEHREYITPFSCWTTQREMEPHFKSQLQINAGDPHWRIITDHLHSLHMH